MGYYVPWKSVTSLWKSAAQIWNQAWYVDTPIPPTPTTDNEGNGALDPNQSPWGNWVENQKRKKKKRKIELACIVNGIEFTEEKESADEVIIGFKVNNVSILHATQHSELELNEIIVELKA